MDLRRAARRLAPAAVLFLLAVVLLAPSTLGGKVLSAGDLVLFRAPFLTKAPPAQPQNPLQFDSAFVFEPDGLVVRAALREGRLPVWTNAQAAGRPLLAAQQSAPLYPLTWISVVFPYWESLAWIVVLKLTLAALGTVLLARALGLGMGAALLSGLAFGFGSYMVDWMLHPHSNAYVLLPWMFLAAERLARSSALRDGALLGAILGVAYLGGQPESSLFVSLATAAWFAYRLAARRPPRREALRSAALAGGAAALGAALAAVMLLPLAEALREAYSTSRAAPPLEPRSGLTLFFPEYWGRPDRADSPVGPSNFAERTFYVGVLPVLLAAAGLLARRPSGPQWFFAGLALVSLAVALDTGPVTDAVSALPGLSEVNLNRLLVLVSFAIAMLAGYGFDRFLAATEAERRRMLIAAAVVVVLPVVAVVAAHPSWLSGLFTAGKRVLGLTTPLTGEVLALASVLRWLALSAAALFLLGALSLWRARSTLLVGAAVGLLALDLLVMGYGYNPSIPKAEAAPPRPPGVKAMQDLSVGGGRVVGIGGLEPNTASLWALEDARGHEQPVMDRHARLWFALGGGTDGVTTAVSGQDPRTPTLLDVFGVRAVILNPLARAGDKLVFTPSLQRDRVAYQGPGALVLEHRSALPRAYVAYRWRPSADIDESMSLMASGSSRQARDEPVIETAERAPPGSRLPASPASVASRSDTEVVLDVNAREAGQLVLLDSFYPGWSAEVDGRSTPIHAANGSFRAVAVPAGRHEVRFSYRPASVVAGGVISLVALLVLGACLLVPLLANRTRSRPAAGVPA